MVLKTIFGRSKPDEAIHDIYSIIVGQARMPQFYTEYGVPDSVDGRFEMVTLHAFLVLRQLKGRNDSSDDTGQALFDVMFEDMDLSLREMGAGDMGVGKRVKAMVQAFYGRIASYEEGLSSEAAPLETALKRNVYATVEFDEAHARNLAAYVRAQDRHMASLDRKVIESGKFVFGKV